MRIPFFSKRCENTIEFKAKQLAEKMFRNKMKEEEEKQDERKIKINMFYVGMPVIMIPDDSGSVSLGIIVGWYEKDIPVIHDYILNKKVLCMCNYQAFTDQRLEALYLLTPSERFAITYTNCSGHDGKPYEIVNEGEWISSQETRRIAYENGFFEKAEEYWNSVK